MPYTWDARGFDATLRWYEGQLDDQWIIEAPVTEHGQQGTLLSNFKGRLPPGPEEHSWEVERTREHVSVTITCDKPPPTKQPTEQPSEQPSEQPTQEPTLSPTRAPTELCTSIVVTVADIGITHIDEEGFEVPTDLNTNGKAVTTYNGIYSRQPSLVNKMPWWRFRKGQPNAGEDHGASIYWSDTDRRWKMEAIGVKWIAPNIVFNTDDDDSHFPGLQKYFGDGSNNGTTWQQLSITKGISN